MIIVVLLTLNVNIIRHKCVHQLKYMIIPKLAEVGLSSSNTSLRPP